MNQNNEAILFKQGEAWRSAEAEQHNMSLISPSSLYKKNIIFSLWMFFVREVQSYKKFSQLFLFSTQRNSSYFPPNQYVSLRLQLGHMTKLFDFENQTSCKNIDLMSAPNMFLEVTDQHWTTLIPSLNFLLINRHSKLYCFYCSLVLLVGSMLASHTALYYMLPALVTQIPDLTRKTPDSPHKPRRASSSQPFNRTFLWFLFSRWVKICSRNVFSCYDINSETQQNTLQLSDHERDWEIM